jgi:threonyl-tRNA synthetase
MSEYIKVMANGEEKSFEKGISARNVLKEFEISYKEIIAAKCNGKLFDLSEEINESCNLIPVKVNSPEGEEILRHSASHIMAQAVMHLFPDVKFAIGPAIDNGFYYDFDLDHTFTPDDLAKIENEMKTIVKANYPFSRKIVPKEEAVKYFKEKGQIYKLEILSEILDPMVSIYTQGDFTDLCRGPHIPSTGYLKNFELLSVAGAYWRGDEKNKMLQRIYGTAFATKDRSKEYLKFLEEAKKRDHRKIGKELDLFSINENVGPGLILWHPKGAMIRKVIEDFWKDEHIKRGYRFLYTPHIARVDLWKISGHWDFYRENMFSPIEVDKGQYMIKPMNCPFHIMVYKSKTRSYRDLPIRYAELGTVYRYENLGFCMVF